MLVAAQISIAEDEKFNDDDLIIDFTEYLQNEGRQISDPAVDTDGIVQKPKLNESAIATKGNWLGAFKACSEIIEILSSFITLEDYPK